MYNSENTSARKTYASKFKCPDEECNNILKGISKRPFMVTCSKCGQLWTGEELKEVSDTDE